MNVPFGNAHIIYNLGIGVARTNFQYPRRRLMAVVEELFGFVYRLACVVDPKFP